MPHPRVLPGQCSSRGKAWARYSPQTKELEQGAKEDASPQRISVQGATVGTELGISPSASTPKQKELSLIWEHVEFSFSERNISNS